MVIFAWVSTHRIFSWWTLALEPNKLSLLLRSMKNTKRLSTTKTDLLYHPTEVIRNHSVPNKELTLGHLKLFRALSAWIAEQHCLDLKIPPKPLSFNRNRRWITHRRCDSSTLPPLSRIMMFNNTNLKDKPLRNLYHPRWVSLKMVKCLIIHNKCKDFLIQFKDPLIKVKQPLIKKAHSKNLIQVS